MVECVIAQVHTLRRKTQCRDLRLRAEEGYGTRSPILALLPLPQRTRLLTRQVESELCCLLIFCDQICDPLAYICAGACQVHEHAGAHERAKDKGTVT